MANQAQDMSSTRASSDLPPAAAVKSMRRSARKPPYRRRWRAKARELRRPSRPRSCAASAAQNARLEAPIPATRIVLRRGSTHATRADYQIAYVPPARHPCAKFLAQPVRPYELQCGIAARRPVRDPSSRFEKHWPASKTMTLQLLSIPHAVPLLDPYVRHAMPAEAWPAWTPQESMPTVAPGSKTLLLSPGREVR